MSKPVKTFYRCMKAAGYLTISRVETSIYTRTSLTVFGNREPLSGLGYRNSESLDRAKEWLLNQIDSELDNRTEIMDREWKKEEMNQDAYDAAISESEQLGAFRKDVAAYDGKARRTSLILY